MAVELATAYISLVPSLKGASDAIGKELGGLGGQGGAGGKALGGGILGGLKGALGPVAAITAGVFGTAAIVSFGKASIDALARIEVINAQTASAITATGGAAGVTAAQVEDLATSLENTTATEKEAIQEGANLLLTFKNIKNGVGEGNDIFNQATTSLVDMARAMGTDPQGAAIQLGKALNDPIAGIASLSRVGVQFTEDQKNLIGTLVESGDVMGAQKIIIGELNSQFGGSGAAFAQTYTGKIAALNDAWGDFGEQLFNNVTPALGGVAVLLTSALNNGITPFLAGTQQKVGALVGFLRSGDFTSAFADAFGVTEDSGLVDFLLTAREAVGGLLAAIGPVLATIGGALLGLFQQLAPVFAPLIPQIVGLVSALSPVQLIFGALAPVLPQIVALISSLATTLGGFLASALTTLLPIVTQISSTLVGGLGGAVSQLLPVVNQLLASIGPLLGSVLTSILPIFGLLATSVDALLPVFVTLAGLLGGILAQAISTLAPVVIEIVDALGPVLTAVLSAVIPIITLLSTIFGTLLTALAPIIPPILDLVSAVLSLIAPLLGLIAPLLTPLVQVFTALLVPILALIQPIIGLLVPVLNVVVGVLAAVVKGIADVLGFFVQLITGSSNAQRDVGRIWQGILTFFGGLWSSIGKVFSDGVRGIVGFFTGLPGQIVSTLSGLGRLLTDIGRNMIQGLLDGAKSLLSTLGSFFLNAVPAFIREPFKAALGIRSPSRVFAGYGENITEGLLIGVGRGERAIASTMSALVPIPTVGGRLGGVTSSAQIAGASVGGFVNNGTIQVTDEEALVDRVAVQQRRAIASQQVRRVGVA